MRSRVQIIDCGPGLGKVISQDMVWVRKKFPQFLLPGQVRIRQRPFHSQSMSNNQIVKVFAGLGEQQVIIVPESPFR